MTKKIIPESDLTNIAIIGSGPTALFLLKYIWEMPQMVQVVGMAHGILFVMYVGGAIYMYKKLNWSMGILSIVILCSILPFGPFYVEKKYL